MRANKAEINASNDCDETPLQVAISKGFTEMAELLRNAGAQMHVPCVPIYLPVDHSKFPKMKSIVGPAVNVSPQFPNIERSSSNNNSVRRAKRKNVAPNTLSQQQQPLQMSQVDAYAQEQMMRGFYPPMEPLLQMPDYANMQMQPPMLPYPYSLMYLPHYTQISQQPQYQPTQNQTEQSRLEPRQQHPNLQQHQIQNPASNYSSNPPSTHLPQSSSVSPHAVDSTYGSPNSYQNSSTNTSGHSDTSSFPSPPSFILARLY